MKKIVYLTNFFTLLILGNAFGQFTLDWNSGYANTNSFNFSNESRKMVRDAAGYTYVLADATSDIDPLGVQGTTTQHYTVLLQYDNTGSLLKTRAIDVGNHIISGFDNKGAFGLEIDSSGFLYIAYNTFNATTGFNVNITKYTTPALIRKWNYIFNPMSTDHGVDLKVGSNGLAHCIVKSVAGSNTQYHIIKSDTAGYSTTPFYSFDQNLDYLSAMAVNSINEIFVTGYRDLSSIKNALTASVKAAGTLKWKKTYNGGTIIRDDSGKQIIIGTDNNVYVCGTSDRGTPNLNDIMVISYYTGNGKFNWANYIDYNSSNDAGVTIKQANPYDIYVGSTSGNTVVISRMKMLFGTVTGRGTYIPAPVSPYSSLNGVGLSQMLVSPVGNVYITGTIMATNFGAQPFSASYLAKFLPVAYRTNSNAAIKIDFDYLVEGTAQESFKATDLALDATNSKLYMLRDKIQPFSTHNKEIVDVLAFDIPSPNRITDEGSSVQINTHIQPNPAINNVEVFSSKKIEKIEVIDFSGRLVKLIEMNLETRGFIDISDMHRGAYMLLIRLENGDLESQKFIKE